MTSCGQPARGACSWRARKGRPPAANRQRSARKGQPVVASPQEVAASSGGGAGRRGGRPLAGRLPAVKGSRRLRRGSGGGGAVRVKEGYGNFFKKDGYAPQNLGNSYSVPFL
ncbi:hypothetical protein BHM03_00021686 [Ensete ventricosum]|nr:hypothetical protein BHM03_00021686 [Ensete ventricosum]